ncbi:hypothetical protein PMAYCL1PPCAC_25784, partial [Pristionchus mayeri]
MCFLLGIGQRTRALICLFFLSTTITANELRLNNENATRNFETEPGAYFYVFNALLFFLICIAVCASILGWMKGREEELSRTRWKAILAFSIPHNAQSVFSFTRDEDAVACLDAIRFMSFSWVAVMNSVSVAVTGVNGEKIREEADYFFSD